MAQQKRGHNKKVFSRFYVRQYVQAQKSPRGAGSVSRALGALSEQGRQAGQREHQGEHPSPEVIQRATRLLLSDAPCVRTHQPEPSEQQGRRRVVRHPLRPMRGALICRPVRPAPKRPETGHCHNQRDGALAHLCLPAQSVRPRTQGNPLPRARGVPRLTQM